MTNMTVNARTTTAHWWLLAAAVVLSLLVTVSGWTAIAQLVVAGLAAHRLTQRPSRREAVVLWVAIGIIALTLIAVVAINVAVFNLSGTSTGTVVVD